MLITRATSAEVFEHLRSSPDGLAPEEAARRLAQFGENRFETAPRTPLAIRFLRELTHFFALVLWLAAGLALAAGLRDPSSGMTTLAVAIALVVLVNATFSFWQEYRTDRAVRMLEELLPRRVRVVRGGALVERPATELVPGDLLVLEAGDQIPADARIVESFAARVDTSNMTGESVPSSRTAEPTAEDDPLRSHNTLLAGTALVAGRAKAVVFATGGGTAFAGVARLTRDTEKSPSPLQLEIRRVSRLLALLAAVLGVGFALAGRARGLGVADALLFGIGILVANVPEGLLPTVTLSLAMGSQRMARRNALVRHLPAIEAIGAATVICTDKTGTLTKNQMAVAEVWLAPGGSGEVPLLERVPLEGGAPARPLPDALLQTLAHCHDLREVDGGALHGDPMEAALVELARAAGHAPRGARAAELPFDTRRKRQSVLVDRVVHTKGAVETLLALCTRHGEAEDRLDDAERARILEREAELAGRGLRVLAFAHRRLPAGAPVEPGAEGEAPEWLEHDLCFDALVGLRDPPRAGVKDSIARCRTAGIRVVMVTGDHPRTGAAIAREIGLLGEGEEARFLRGVDVERMTDAALRLALGDGHVHFARMSPEDKTRVVRAFRATGEVVAVTGDGVNDAPALQAADVGIAMGKSGTDVAREVASVVLLDDDFSTIVGAVEEGRAVFDNLRKFLAYILTSNIPELVPYVAFVLLDVPLPLTIIQVLAVDLGTDMLPALGLGAEPPAADVMTRPPRARGARLLDLPLLARAYGWLGGLEAAASTGVFFAVLSAGGWTWGARLAATDPLYLQGTTACLGTIVCCQVANVLLCKDPVVALTPKAALGNRLVLWGILAELTLMGALAYTPLGWLLFGTAPLPAWVWGFGAAAALGMFALEETRKRLVRRLARGVEKLPGAGRSRRGTIG